MAGQSASQLAAGRRSCRGNAASVCKTSSRLSSLNQENDRCRSRDGCDSGGCRRRRQAVTIAAVERLRCRSNGDVAVTRRNFHSCCVRVVERNSTIRVQVGKNVRFKIPRSKCATSADSKIFRLINGGNKVRHALNTVLFGVTLEYFRFSRHQSSLTENQSSIVINP